MSKKRPNILFLFSDEHRPDCTGFSGNEVIRTPHLDWLAQEGVVFENAYTPSPICVPARQCVLSGQFPKTCECEGWIDLKPNHMTYPRRFSQYGYETVAFGKMHLLGPDALQGWQQFPVGDAGSGQIFDPIEKSDPTNRKHYWDPQGMGDWGKWSDEKEIRRAGVGDHQEKNDELSVMGFEHFVNMKYVGSTYDRFDPDKPRVMYLGLRSPHYPYQTRRALFDYYLPRVEEFPVEEACDHPFLGYSAWPQVKLQAGQEIGWRDVRRGRAAYYGMIETMDEHCGRALQALRDAGQDLDDWIIIYSSDHGEMLGEHGIWEKQKFYEGSARVPLVIRWPNGFEGGKRITENVNLCDLFATLCELSGIEVPEGLDSRSLVPLLNGEVNRETGWDDETCSFFLQQGYENVMIKRGALKYQYYHHEEQGLLPEVLFDLHRDPLERENLIDDPQYQSVLPAFRERLFELGYGAAIQA